LPVRNSSGASDPAAAASGNVRRVFLAFATGPHWGRLLSDRGYDVREIADQRVLADALQRDRADVLILGRPVVDSATAATLIAAISRVPGAPRIIVVTERSSEDLMLQLFRAGAADYLREPLAAAELLASVERVLASTYLPNGADEPASSYGVAPRDSALLGVSPAMTAIRHYVDRVARTDTNVLITGETGVGKELVSQMIHAASRRASRPRIAINCAAIPESLLESELFGYHRGAFTGADATRDGVLTSADGGSVFFDEIGDMGLAAQAKILRAIEAREVNRLGSRSAVPFDIRIIAATNQDLERLIAQGQFRKDLFYRLNVARVHVPPLRERREDLEPLLGFYVNHFNRRFGRDVAGFTPDALACLQRYSWPGNVREVKNLVEAVFVGLDGHRIRFVDLPEPFRRSLEQHSTLPIGERERLVNALFATNWNKSKAAEELHWSRMTLYRKLAKYHVMRDAEIPRHES
jgi:DNA-binding NtrC family response regulator